MSILYNTKENNGLLTHVEMYTLVNINTAHWHRYHAFVDGVCVYNMLVPSGFRKCSIHGKYLVVFLFHHLGGLERSPLVSSSTNTHWINVAISYLIVLQVTTKLHMHTACMIIHVWLWRVHVAGSITIVSVCITYYVLISYCWIT